MLYWLHGAVQPNLGSSAVAVQQPVFPYFSEVWHGDGSLRLRELPDLCLTQGLEAAAVESFLCGFLTNVNACQCLLRCSNSLISYLSAVYDAKSLCEDVQGPPKVELTLTEMRATRWNMWAALETSMKGFCTTVNLSCVRVSKSPARGSSRKHSRKGAANHTTRKLRGSGADFKSILMSCDKLTWYRILSAGAQ